MPSFAEIRTVEMHTGGEPVRIVVDGYPPIEGETILDKRRLVRSELDHLRRALMFEPRGHADMYGVIPVEPDHPDADLAVLFMHNEGYSTMCGHATIALGRWAIDTGLVQAMEPVTEVGLQVPAGLVRIRVAVSGGETGAVSFDSVPAFLADRDLAVEIPGVGSTAVDIGFGGAYYALVPADRLGITLGADPVAAVVDAAWRVTTAARDLADLRHPDHADLGFLYGTIVTDGGDGGAAPSVNVCVFADRQVDRSPTGSGVTARLAAMHARDEVAVGEERTFESIVGSQFTGRVTAETAVGERPAVVVEVTGRAHYTGEGLFRLEEGDDLPGFLVR